MADKRVVITGVGPVSSIGIGRQDFAVGLNGAPRGDAVIRNFDVRDYLESEKAYLDRASQFGFAAMSLAIEDANLDLKTMDRSAVGLILGSAAGCLETTQLFFNDYLEKGPRFVKPILFPHTYANTTISLLAIEYGLDGYHLDFASGATSSSGALMQAYDLIRTGCHPLVFVGGFEALSPMRLRGCELAEPSSWAPGEGAGILILEEADHARQRGAAILGELLGGGMTGGNIARAMHLACGNLPTGTDDVRRIFAATPGGELDLTEMAAIREFQGDRRGDIPITRLKALLGETLGADTALRLIAALGKEHPGVTLVNSIDAGGNVVCLTVQRLAPVTSDVSPLTSHASL